MGKRDGMSGVSNQVYYTWIRQRMDMREVLVCHENVPQFGIEHLRADLGSLYEQERIVLSPHELGWPARRKRQFVVMRLRSHLPAASMSELLNPDCRITTDTVIARLFARNCECNQGIFIIANEQDLDEEKQWAGKRTLVWDFVSA